MKLLCSNVLSISKQLLLTLASRRKNSGLNAIARAVLNALLCRADVQGRDVALQLDVSTATTSPKICQKSAFGPM